jgi:hypothetical protein
MATCSQKIANVIETGSIAKVDKIIANTQTKFKIGPGQKYLLIFTTTKQETIRFITELNPIGQIGPIKMTINIFYYNEDSGLFIDLGSTLIEELRQEFQKDLTVGTYFMCVSNSFSSFDVYITGKFTGFKSWTKFVLDCYEGSFSSAKKLSQPAVEKPCARPIQYEIIEGSLPPGITMTKAGRLHGILPNLDCCEENAKLSPSVDWFGQLPTGEWHSWGRQWRFKVRITIPEFPTAVAERWFCIRVYNNWDIDKENFIKQLPFSRTYEVVVKPDDEITLEDQCQPCSSKKKDKALPPYSPLPCLDCPSDNVKTDIQMFKIPETVSVTADNLVVWYQNAMKLDSETMSKEVKEFLTNLMESDIFTNLLIKKGIIEAENEKLAKLEQVKIALQEMNGYIQLRQNALINGRNEDDIDHEFLTTIQKLNQSLPMEFLVFAGEYSHI